MGSWGRGERLGRKRLIVGVDPGTTAAFAALDLSGKPVASWSARGAGREELVKVIREVGDPVIVASDVATPPELVVKVAAAFNARLFFPDYDLTEVEKKRMTRGMGFANTHEMDALAAALKAYHSVENVMRKVERIAKEKGLSVKAEEMKALTLSGVRVEDAAEMLAERERKLPELPRGEIGEKPARKIGEELRAKDERIRELLVSVAELRKANERLEAERRGMSEKIALLEKGAYARARESAEVRRRDAEIARLRKFIGKLIAQLKAGKGVRSSLKGMAEKKEIDLENIVGEYRAERE